MSRELIKKHQEKRHINDVNFDSFDLISLLVKKQNIQLIERIGKKKNLDEEEINELKNDFLKIGFYTPIITKNKHEESSQIYVVKKNIKKYKKILKK